MSDEKPEDMEMMEFDPSDPRVKHELPLKHYGNPRHYGDNYNSQNTGCVLMLLALCIPAAMFLGAVVIMVL